MVKGDTRARDLASNSDSKACNSCNTRSRPQVLEVMVVSIATSALMYTLVISFPVCTNNGSFTCSHADNWGEWCSGPTDNTTCTGTLAACVRASSWVCIGGDNHGHACKGRGDCQWRGGKCTAVTGEEVFGVQLHCPEGQYDELATIFFGSREPAIVRMVSQSQPHAPFDNLTLFLTSLVTYALVLVTYGIKLPMGLFMPNALVGASMGRLFGQLIKNWMGLKTIYTGAYALAGTCLPDP